jgi:hypothetical protein
MAHRASKLLLKKGLVVLSMFSVSVDMRLLVSKGCICIYILLCCYVIVRKIVTTMI